MYSNRLFPGLRRHKFSNQTYLSNRAVFLHDQKVRQKLIILVTKRAFKVKKAFLVTLRVLKITGLEFKTARLTFERKQQQP